MAADPDAVFQAIGQWTVDREAYYVVRNLRPSESVIQAAQFIYLNKTAWNGLYRVNKSGGFNVPYGLPKSSNIVPLAALQSASTVLTRARLLVSDFEATVSDARRGDLVFVDPPYVTAHSENGFVAYNENLFSWDDQIRLASLCADLASKGVHIVVTNAAHASIRDLYTDFHESEISRMSTLAGKAVHRRRVTESIFSTRKPASD